MASIALSEILKLVGKLDDSQGADPARERFRRFLKENVESVDIARDYIEECLRNSGDQYNRALQDLTNHLGHFLGFEVAYGRYQGVQGKIGFDGHWKSPDDFHVVIEVKTSEVYPIKAATLVNYISDMISAKLIPDWDHALGLYVVGRPDPEIQQLQNAIIAEKRTHQLRIVSVDSLLTIAELMAEFDVNHTDVLNVLRPSGPKVDPLVDLLARLAATPRSEMAAPEPQQTVIAPPAVAEPSSATIPVEDKAETGQIEYWLTPVKSDETQSAEEVVTQLVAQAGVYAFGDNTPGRKRIKVGDWICFYATGTGVIAHAQIASLPEDKLHPKVRDPEKYPWVFQVQAVQLYTEDPVVIDADRRTQLDAFKKHTSTTSPWAWFVQATRRVTEHDFLLLTRQ